MLTELMGMFHLFTVHALLGLAIITTGASLSWLTSKASSRIR